MAEITRSSLSVARNGTRFAPVICVSSSSTPSALATILATSMSKPGRLVVLVDRSEGGDVDGHADPDLAGVQDVLQVGAGR